MTQEEKNKILADKNSASNATAESAQQTSMNGVNKDTLDKANSTFTATDAQTKAQGKASNQLMNYENIANTDSIVSNKTWSTINSKFKTPSAVTEADAYLKGQLSKIQSGKTSYSDSVREMMDKITNREKFSYDVDNDPLFQQALASAMNSGKSAMQDTIGQASALTGGYGSSYATSAGNQAYNAYIEDAYNNLPQYYQMALDAYNSEGEELYRQLDMYNTADATEYNRTLTAYDATGTYRDRLYNEAYQQFRDTKSDAFASANLQISEHGQLANDAYNLYNAYANEADKMYEREFQKWDAEVNNAMQYAQMLNSDYWSQTNFDEGVRQYEQSFAEEQRQFDEKLAFEDTWNQKNFDEGVRQFDEKLENDNYWNEQEMGYKYDSLAKQDEWNKADLGYKYSALAQDQKQFEATQAAKATSSTKSSYVTAEDGSTYKEPTATEKQKALEAYNTGGQEAYDKYVDSLASDVYVEAIADYVFGNSEEGTKGYGVLPYTQRTYTKTKQTTNWGWGVDNNDKVKDEYGNEYTLKELKEKLKEEGTDNSTIDLILKELNKKDKGSTYKYSSK